MPNTEGLTKVSIEKFNSGRNGKVVPFALPDDQSAGGVNFRADEVALKLRPGFGNINNTAVAGTSPIRGLHRYYRMTGSNRWWLVMAGTSLYKVTDGGTVTNYGMNLTRGKEGNFAMLRGRAYVVNGSQGVIRVLGNTAALLASENITAPTGPPRVLSNIVVINACDTSANWTGGTVPGSIWGGQSMGGSFSIVTASPWEGSGNAKLNKTGPLAGGWIGRKLTSLNLNLTTAKAFTLYFRCNESNVQIRIWLQDSSSGWSWPVNVTLGTAGQWQRVVVDLSGKAPAELDTITSICIGAWTILVTGETRTLEWDYMIVGDAAGGGNQDAWYISSYYDSTTSKYSGPSPRSGLVKIQPDQLNNLVQVRGSADTAIEKIHLYRTQAGLTQPFYFVTAVNFAASTVVTVRDTIKDSELGQAYQRASIAGAQAPPTGASIIWQHKHRMFYVDPTDPSKIWASNINDAETCPNVEQTASALALIAEEFQETTGCWFYIDRDNGQRITAGISADNVAIILKDRSAYALYGDSPLNFAVQKLRDNCGGIGMRALAFHESDAIWVDWQNHTVWLWSAEQGLRDIGQPVSDLLKGVSQSDAANICVVGHDRRAVITFKRGSTQEWVEYDFRTGTWHAPDGEILRSGFMHHRGQERRIMAVAGGPNDSGQLVYGNSTGFLKKQTDGTVVDGSTGVSGIWIGKAFDFRDSGKEHRIRFADLEIQGVASNTVPRVQLGFFYNRLASLTATPNWTAGVNPTAVLCNRRITVPSKVKGARIQPMIKCAGKTAVAVHRLTMWVSQVR